MEIYEMFNSTVFIYGLAVCFAGILLRILLWPVLKYFHQRRKKRKIIALYKEKLK